VITSTDKVTNDIYATYEERAIQVAGLLRIDQSPTGQITITGGHDQLPSAIEKCPTRYVAIAVSVGDDRGTHANMLLFDKKEHTVEHFEPHGVHGQFARPLRDYLKKETGLFGSYRWVPIENVCPLRGPQMNDLQSIHWPKDCPVGGYCQIYATMWLHLRLITSDIDATAPYTFWSRFTQDELVELAQRYHGWIRQADALKSSSSNSIFKATNYGVYRMMGLPSTTKMTDFFKNLVLGERSDSETGESK
jgi:hypothetical protein